MRGSGAGEKPATAWKQGSELRQEGSKIKANRSSDGAKDKKHILLDVGRGVHI